MHSTLQNLLDVPVNITLLFLYSCLCFERVGRAVRDPERIIISLKLVKDIVKAKPFAVLPGSGMSIEVTLDRGDKVCVRMHTYRKSGIYRKNDPILR